MQFATDAVVVAVAVVAAVIATVAAAVAEMLLLLVRVRVRQGSVQRVVHVCAPKMRMCRAACARLGFHASVRVAGIGQWVRDGLAETSAGARGSPGAARRRAWAVQAQRHLTFAVLLLRP